MTESEYYAQQDASERHKRAIEGHRARFMEQILLDPDLLLEFAFDAFGDRAPLVKRLVTALVDDMFNDEGEDPSKVLIEIINQEADKRYEQSIALTSLTAV